VSGAPERYQLKGTRRKLRDEKGISLSANSDSRNNTGGEGERGKKKNCTVARGETSADTNHETFT